MQSLIDAACEAEEKIPLDELEAFANKQREVLETSTGFLCVRTAADGRRLWHVVGHNSPVSVPSDLRTALAVARKTFGRVTLAVWDADKGEFDSEMVADPNY